MRAALVTELSVVVRSGDHEPLIEHFIDCYAPEVVT